MYWALLRQSEQACLLCYMRARTEKFVAVSSPVIARRKGSNPPTKAETLPSESPRRKLCHMQILSAVGLA